MYDWPNKTMSASGRIWPERKLSGIGRSRCRWMTPTRPTYRWFADGQLNVSHNCLTCICASAGEKIAILFEGEPGDVRKVTYAELHGEVCRFANALKSLGIWRSRRHIHASDPGGRWRRLSLASPSGSVRFSSNAVNDRIEDAGASWWSLRTAAGAAATRSNWKRAVDRALAGRRSHQQNVIVYRRTGIDCEMREGRDLWWQDAVNGLEAVCEPEWVDAEHPLFLLYTSDPRQTEGIQHSSGGIPAQRQDKHTVDIRSQG